MDHIVIVSNRVATLQSAETPDAAGRLVTLLAAHQRLLPTLRADQQELLKHADLESEPHARIAASLGTTANAIAVRLCRARRLLRDRLTRVCGCCCPAEAMACCCELGVGEIDRKEPVPRALFQSGR